MKDFWFESDPEFLSGDQVWDFVSSNWVPKCDTLGRELFTDRHHALHCSKCNLGGQLLECDYCDCVWHKKCADITRRINPEELFRCPTCRTRDEDTMPVTSIEQRRAAAIARNVELTVIRKQAARDSQMRKTAAKVLRAQNKKKKEELAEAARVAQKAAWEQKRPARERAAAARTRASRSAEAAETAAAPGGTPLPVGVEPLDPTRRTTRSVSSKQANAFFAANDPDQATKAFAHMAKMENIYRPEAADDQAAEQSLRDGCTHCTRGK